MENIKNILVAIFVMANLAFVLSLGSGCATVTTRPTTSPPLPTKVANPSEIMVPSGWETVSRTPVVTGGSLDTVIEGAKVNPY